jgi:hypothetical protein
LQAIIQRECSRSKHPVRVEAEDHDPGRWGPTSRQVGQPPPPPPPPPPPETALGGTIAHGFYTFALAPKLLGELISFDHFGFAMNYGLDRVRFTAPLPVGDSVRMRASLDSVAERPDGADLRTTLTFERAGGDRPVCVAGLLVRMRS